MLETPTKFYGNSDFQNSSSTLSVLDLVGIVQNKSAV